MKLQRSVLKKHLGNRISIVQLVNDQPKMYKALVCCKEPPYSTASVTPTPKAENVVDNRLNYGVLKYVSPDEIGFISGEFGCMRDGEIPVLCLHNSKADQDDIVKKGNCISGILYKEFAEYLRKAGIKTP